MFFCCLHFRVLCFVGNVLAIHPEPRNITLVHVHCVRSTKKKRFSPGLCWVCIQFRLFLKRLPFRLGGKPGLFVEEFSTSFWQFMHLGSLGETGPPGQPLVLWDLTVLE